MTSRELSGPRPGPDWVRHAIWWHVYPLGFVDAAGTGQIHPPGPRIHTLSAYLHYAIELGVNGLILGPIFESESHGYDTRDYFKLDPRLGVQQDFDWFLAAAKLRGLRVLLDGVFNHVGRSFPTFQGALVDPDLAQQWFNPEPPLRLETQTGTPAVNVPQFAVFEGHGSLVTLNHDSPEVRDFVVRVMQHWLELGIDGWRLDAAYAVPPKFWSEVTQRVRSRFPSAYFLGEVIHGDYVDLVQRSDIDSVTQYELWHAIFNSINDENFFELEWSLRRHNAFLQEFVPQTFVGNHDVTRIATRLIDPRHVEHAYVLLLCLGGSPSIYYGDEQAFEGLKEDREGGDDVIRPAFPPEADGGALRLPRAGWATYRVHQKLISIRRQNPWLFDAQSEVLHLANSELLLRLVGRGAEQLFVALNLGDADIRVRVAGATRVLHGVGWLETESDGMSTIVVTGHGSVVLQ